MKQHKTLLISLALLVVVSALYRLIPDRQFGFAPQWAMALFAGAVIRPKSWAFALPVFSMFVSDVFYHTLYLNGLTQTPGFYEGQTTNYVLFACVTAVGFLMRSITVPGVAVYSVVVCLSFFLLSNFFVWANGAGYGRPQTLEGLMLCYGDGLPFLRNSILATFVFSAVLFGSFVLIKKLQGTRGSAIAETR